MFLVRPGQMTQWTPIHHNGPSFLLRLSAENGRLWKRSWNCCWSACKCSFASFGGRYWWLCWLHDGWLDRLPLGLFFEVCTAVWNKYVLKYVLFETRMLYWSSLHVCMVCIYICICGQTVYGIQCSTYVRLHRQFGDLTKMVAGQSSADLKWSLGFCIFICLYIWKQS